MTVKHVSLEMVDRLVETLKCNPNRRTEDVMRALGFPGYNKIVEKPSGQGQIIEKGKVKNS